MNVINIILTVCFVAVCFWGCTSISEHPRQKPVPPPLSPVATMPPMQKPKPRQWSNKQLNLLRAFALQESPKLWQTVQALRAEHETRMAALVKLRVELIDFGRNPDADPDYVSLKAANDRLLESVNVIYAKIEDAYIAYKKFQATPGHKEYGDMMKRALEDGIQEADAAVAKYRTMFKGK